MRVLIPAIVVPLVVLLLYLFVPGLKERPWTALRVTGAIPAFVGYILFVTARLQLGKAFSVTPQARELVTLGLYSQIRNPIYIGVAGYVARLDRRSAPVLAVRAFPGVAGFARVAGPSRGEGLPR
jgi:protein-S-isoprenylcysteine O-methyltransferase Ste14